MYLFLPQDGKAIYHGGNFKIQKSNDNKAKIKVRLEKINKYYYGKKEKVYAVKELSFHCRDKEFIAMLKPSGCGKSSTLRMIAGLEEVNSGSIHFVDREVTNLHPSKRIITEIGSYTHYKQGSEIFVSFDIEHMHLFDMDTLECIDYKFR